MSHKDGIVKPPKSQKIVKKLLGLQEFNQKARTAIFLKLYP